MEGGLLRDIFTHQLITLDHWNNLMIRPFYTREEIAGLSDRWDPDTVVAPTYDPHCANGEISNGCEPVEVISADNLMDYNRGPAETSRIATALKSDSTTGYHVIGQQAWGKSSSHMALYLCIKIKEPNISHML